MTTVTGFDGVDTLIGIETLQFGDQAVVLSSAFADQDGFLRARMPDISEQSLSSMDLLVL